MNEPRGFAAQILRQLLDERVQILQVLVEGMVYLRAQLCKQIEWKVVLVVESVDDRHALLDLAVSQVEALHHGAYDGDAVGHEQSAEKHDEETKYPFDCIEGEVIAIADDGGPEEGT